MNTTTTKTVTDRDLMQGIREHVAAKRARPWGFNDYQNKQLA